MSRKLLADLLERVGWTALQAFLATWIVTQGLGAQDFKIAGVAALVAAAKVLLGTQIGARDSGSWLPADLEPPD